MNKFESCFSAVTRLMFSATILLFYTTFLYSEALSCPAANELNAGRTSVSKAKNFDALTEEFSFLIQDFKINHQSENNNLNIKVRFCYENNMPNSKYPDFRAILNDIQDFLSDYPNETDYWEIVNKNVTLMILRKYSMLSSVTSEIQVSPSRLTPYTRSSITTRFRSKTVKTPDKKAR